MREFWKSVRCFFGWHRWQYDPQFGPFHPNQWECAWCGMRERDRWESF